MSRPRKAHAERDRLNITITIPRGTLELLDAEAAREGSGLSAYFLRAMESYLAAPQIGGRRILPSSGFAVLQIAPDNFCFIPTNWSPQDLRLAANILEAQGKS
jgi:hypothetical protein